ncbi:flagellar type III secretion system pore protein FliP [Syntrophorhabdus aromaticivorans]|uniref:Flagellar biosynthetic protein FliP n=1 Tax=Syntrophorhabdus aromaticivorans TaxID=328301 RepID=A0A351U0J9_9BACT|nr:flagellar type III secretion system pore protein FliP [Syntrophorhabdus aromaticivorans]NLW36339.1 flagellar type III secretion system pore protein FliP [Syntrophorhabdus aromaticivorans]HBA53480.1 flagellar biosynthetic protein FliP [Syntrophorhabdus aromaticivorans]
MRILLIGILALSMLCVPAIGSAKANAKVRGDTKSDLIGSFTGSEGSKNLISIVIVLSILAFAPAILLLMSSFTRIVIVLSFLRQAMGVQQLPPNQIIIGLSLFLTFFIMAPTYEKVHTAALGPYMSNKIGYEEFLSKSSHEMSAFMLRFTKEKDLALFMNLAAIQRPKNETEIPLRVVVPAFAISELKRAFQIGFLLYIPFMVIDMVVASVLLSAGMMMLPPIFISLPFKLMLFVLVDGWNLLVGSIVKGFY